LCTRLGRPSTHLPAACGRRLSDRCQWLINVWPARQFCPSASNAAKLHSTDSLWGNTFLARPNRTTKRHNKPPRGQRCKRQQVGSIFRPRSPAGTLPSSSLCSSLLADARLSLSLCLSLQQRPLSPPATEVSDPAPNRPALVCGARLASFGADQLSCRNLVRRSFLSPAFVWPPNGLLGAAILQLCGQVLPSRRTPNC